MRRRRDPESMGGRIAADGSIVLGPQGLQGVQKTATGVYILTFSPFFRMAAVMPAIVGAGAGYAMVAYVGNTATITTKSAANAAADIDFTFIAVSL